LIAAIPNLIMAFSYAELSAMYKSNASEYGCVRDAFGDKAASMSTYLLLAFMVFNAATVLLFIGTFLDAKHYRFAFCFGILSILSVISFYGMDVSKKITTNMGIVEIATLSLVIVLGMQYWQPSRLVSFPSMTEHTGMLNFWIGAFLALFLYNGFDSVVKLSEEAKDPAKDVPIGLIGSVSMTSVIYVLLALTAVSLPIMKEVAQSNFPITKMAAFVGGMGKSAILVTLIGWFILVNTFFISIISLSRFLYGLAKDGKLPNYLASVHPTQKTPYKAIATTFIVLVLAIMIGEGEKAASLANLFYLVFMTIIHIAVIKLRRMKPDAVRPFKIPGNIGNTPVMTVVGIIVNLLFIAASFCLFAKSS